MSKVEFLDSSGRFLPPGWELAWDSTSYRPFYVDHNTKTTTWLNPTEQRTKPKSFSQCRVDELPYGWERVDDPVVGVYYVDHIRRRNQWTNPVTDWLKHLSLLNQHHYSNSHNILSNEQSANSLDSNTHTTSLSNTIEKQDNSYQASDFEKSANSLNNSASLDADIIGTTRSNISARSKFDASLLDIMDNCFGRGSSHSVEV